MRCARGISGRTELYRLGELAQLWCQRDQPLPIRVTGTVRYRGMLSFPNWRAHDASGPTHDRARVV